MTSQTKRTKLDELIELPVGMHTPANVEAAFYADIGRSIATLEPLLHSPEYVKLYSEHVLGDSVTAGMAMPTIMHARATADAKDVKTLDALLLGIAEEYPRAILSYAAVHQDIPRNVLTRARRAPRIKAEPVETAVDHSIEPSMSLQQIDKFFIGTKLITAADDPIVQNDTPTVVPAPVPVSHELRDYGAVASPIPANAPIVKYDMPTLIPAPEPLPIELRNYGAVAGTRDVKEKYQPLALKSRESAYAALHVMVTWHEKYLAHPVDSASLVPGVKPPVVKANFMAILKKIEKTYPGTISQYILKRNEAVAGGRPALDETIATLLTDTATKVFDEKTPYGRSPTTDHVIKTKQTLGDILAKPAAKWADGQDPKSFTERADKDPETGRGGSGR